MTSRTLTASIASRALWVWNPTYSAPASTDCCRAFRELRIGRCQEIDDPRAQASVGLIPVCHKRGDVESTDLPLESSIPSSDPDVIH